MARPLSVFTSSPPPHPSSIDQVYIGGDDFKSGQTKMKSVLVDFLVSAGIKPTAIVSYNHLGNNDGKNLSAPQTFRSKVSQKRGGGPSVWLGLVGVTSPVVDLCLL